MLKGHRRQVSRQVTVLLPTYVDAVSFLMVGVYVPSPPFLSLTPHAFAACLLLLHLALIGEQTGSEVGTVDCRSTSLRKIYQCGGAVIP